jgi:hypothetical protein
VSFQKVLALTEAHLDDDEEVAALSLNRTGYGD